MTRKLIDSRLVAESLLRFTGVRDALLIAPRVLSPAAFLQVEGERNSEIVIDGGLLSKAAKPIVAARGATQGAVRLRA